MERSKNRVIVATPEAVARKVEQLCKWVEALGHSVSRLHARIDSCTGEEVIERAEIRWPSEPVKATPKGIALRLDALDEWTYRVDQDLRRIESLLNQINGDATSRAEMQRYLRRRP